MSGWALTFNGSVKEEYVENHFRNAWAVKRGAADFVGVSGIRFVEAFVVGACMVLVHVWYQFLTS